MERWTSAKLVVVEDCRQPISVAGAGADLFVFVSTRLQFDSLTKNRRAAFVNAASYLAMIAAYIMKPSKSQHRIRAVELVRSRFPQCGQTSASLLTKPSQSLHW